MESVWQYLVVAASVVAALGYLVAYYIRRNRRKNACDHCPVRKSQAERMLH